jgi:tricorn protease
MKRSLRLLACLSFLCLLPLAALAATEGGIPRFPDVGAEHIAFSAGGDIWVVAREGGVARRLTSHEGDELHPLISPDGRRVAFSGDYDGDRDIFVMPIEGGTPQRLTFHSNGQVDHALDWTPDGQRILFRSGLTSANPRYAELFTVGLDGALPEPLPTLDAGLAQFTPDGGSIVYNRIFRNNRTWKRYRGGMQQDLWLFDLDSLEARRLTRFEGTDTSPMVADDGTIYFVSDRADIAGGGEDYARRNIFAIDPDGGEVRQVTRHRELDVLDPSLGAGAIVYQLGTTLRLLDLASGDDRELDIVIPSDQTASRPGWRAIGDNLTDASVSPSAKRVAVVARGRLFTVPEKKGDPRKLAGDSSSRIREATWSPDGNTLAYISDRSGEDAVYLVPQDGDGEPRKIGPDERRWIENLNWSPDSTRLSVVDSQGTLYLLDVDAGTLVAIDEPAVQTIESAVWSADSRWLAYSKLDRNFLGSIFLYDTENDSVHRVTGRYAEDIEPAFDPEGKYLYFASRRNWDLVPDAFEQRFVQQATDYIYLVTLRDDVPHPFPPESDEEEIDEPEEKKDAGEPAKGRKAKKKAAQDEKADDEEDSGPAPVEIDLEGIEQRQVRLPLPAGRYTDLTGAKGKLFFREVPTGRGIASGGRGGGAGALKVFDLAERKVDEVIDGIVGYELAAGGDKLLVVAPGRQLAIVDAKPGQKLGDSRLDLDGLRDWVVPREEWAQILREAHRYMREHFYDPNLHGRDWDAVYRRYGQMLDNAAFRADVDFLVGEMIGELNVGHAYVRGFGRGNGERLQTGLLGADYEVVDGHVRIARVLEGEPGDPDRTAPLRKPATPVREGDFLLAIDGRPIEGPAANPHRLLVGKVGRQVTLTVNDEPTFDGAREVTVVPVDDEGELRYWSWVESNRTKVAEATNGRVGYIHLPNTAVAGYTEFVRGLAAETGKDGLIIDVRYNGGGFIPEMFIEKLLKPYYNSWITRSPNRDFHTPSRMWVPGPKVCITNGYAGSGGDAFPYYFRQFDLGPLVGTRTWGGLVGIQGMQPFVDGRSGVTAPSFAMIDRQGRFSVERVGVAPDIEVDATPEDTARGRDPQLNKAIEIVLEELEDWESPVPERPAPENFPVRP